MVSLLQVSMRGRRSVRGRGPLHPSHRAASEGQTPAHGHKGAETTESNINITASEASKSLKSVMKLQRLLSEHKSSGAPGLHYSRWKKSRIFPMMVSKEMKNGCDYIKIASAHQDGAMVIEGSYFQTSYDTPSARKGLGKVLNHTSITRKLQARRKLRGSSSTSSPTGSEKGESEIQSASNGKKEKGQSKVSIRILGEREEEDRGSKVKSRKEDSQGELSERSSIALPIKDEKYLVLDPDRYGINETTVDSEVEQEDSDDEKKSQSEKESDMERESETDKELDRERRSEDYDDEQRSTVSEEAEAQESASKVFSCSTSSGSHAFTVQSSSTGRKSLDKFTEGAQDGKMSRSSIRPANYTSSASARGSREPGISALAPRSKGSRKEQDEGERASSEEDSYEGVMSRKSDGFQTAMSTVRAQLSVSVCSKEVGGEEDDEESENEASDSEEG
ncbi:uncharacterized protein LOC114909435 [Scleropages formosus]|uniref:uncharacterized protein LOC114909435 n=1 Tax=Scleropages formosus TaxID=113540 RepID=UPI0010FA8CEF|nr:uncharacterized protein LOC114909435 [Scleropages formosus]